MVVKVIGPTLWRVLCASGLSTAAFVATTLINPFNQTASSLGMVMSLLAICAIGLGTLEIVARLTSGPPPAAEHASWTLPWVALGILSTIAVALGFTEAIVSVTSHRIIGNLVTWLLRAGTLLAFVGSFVAVLRAQTRS